MKKLVVIEASFFFSNINFISTHFILISCMLPQVYPDPEKINYNKLKVTRMREVPEGAEHARLLLNIAKYY